MKKKENNNDKKIVKLFNLGSKDNFLTKIDPFRLCEILKEQEKINLSFIGSRNIIEEKANEYYRSKIKIEPRIIKNEKTGKIEIISFDIIDKNDK